MWLNHSFKIENSSTSRSGGTGSLTRAKFVCFIKTMIFWEEVCRKAEHHILREDFIKILELIQNSRSTEQKHAKWQRCKSLLFFFFKHMKQEGNIWHQGESLTKTCSISDHHSLLRSALLFFVRPRVTIRIYSGQHVCFLPAAVGSAISHMFWVPNNCQGKMKICFKPVS